MLPHAPGDGYLLPMPPLTRSALLLAAAFSWSCANPPAQCMLDCSDAACPSGYYCGADDTCTADCSAANALCGDGTCNPSTGVCTPPDSAVKKYPA